MAYMKKPNGKSYMRLTTQEEIDKIKAKLKKEEEQKRWHTGTPTEEGWYLLECSIDNSDEIYYVTDYWNNEVGYWIYNRVIRWQKIEP